MTVLSLAGTTKPENRAPSHKSWQDIPVLSLAGTAQPENHATSHGDWQDMTVLSYGVTTKPENHATKSSPRASTRIGAFRRRQAHARQALIAGRKQRQGEDEVRAACGVIQIQAGELLDAIEPMKEGRTRDEQPLCS